MQRQRVQSSNIASVGWSEGTMEIEFLNGGIYQYANVPHGLYIEFLSSNSKGQFFHSRIKSVFDYRKADQPVIVVADYDDDEESLVDAIASAVTVIVDDSNSSSSYDDFSGGGGSGGGGGASGDW